MAEIFLSFLKLGFCAFGGPVAHLSFFRQEFVENRQWLSDAQYSELVALCQILPGPASSQVGFCLGLHRSGLMGGLLAFIAFTLPSALLLIMFAMFASVWLEQALVMLFIQALKLLAVFVVMQAVWGMAKTFCDRFITALIAIISASILLLFDHHLASIGVILISMLVGALFFEQKAAGQQTSLNLGISKRGSHICIVLFVSLLISLSLFSPFAIFYQAGTLVFGGGHVVLPLLEAPLVDGKIIEQNSFIAGYGATQLVPGPIFTFAAYLGFVLPIDNGFTSIPLLNALLATLLIFLPGFLLVMAAIPYWADLLSYAHFRNAILAASAAVVGVLLATLISPIITNSIDNTILAVLCVFSFILIQHLRLKLLAIIGICLLLSATNTYLIQALIMPAYPVG